MNSIARCSEDPARDYSIPEYTEVEIPELPRFEYTKRELIDGSRLDYEQMLQMSDEEILAYGNALGPPLAINWLLQRAPQTHEFIVVARDENGFPLKIINIGTSESFFNNRETTDIGYVEDMAPVYGCFLARWLAAIEAREGVSREQAEVVKAKFAANFMESFAQMLKDASARWPEAELYIREQLEPIEREFVLQKELDVGENLHITSYQAQKPEYEQESIGMEIVTSAWSLLDRYTQAYQPGYSRKAKREVPADGCEQIINAITGCLMSHAVEGAGFYEVERILENMEYGQYNLKQRLQFINLLDVSSWILTVAHKKDHIALAILKESVEFALGVEDPAKFVKLIRKYHPSTHLYSSVARRFYHAVRDLHRDSELSQDPNGHILFNEHLRMMTRAGYDYHIDPTSADFQ